MPNDQVAHVPSPSNVQTNSPCWVYRYENWTEAFFQRWIDSSSRTTALVVTKGGRPQEVDMTHIDFGADRPKYPADHN